MQAVVGDQLLIENHRIGQPTRRGEVVEVRGDDGRPPYLVRWDDDGHTTLLFPGSDCIVDHLAASAPRDAGEESG
ncbi:MAG: DUF1918 domain-containing protein [Ilumatobacteraceae bacterium]